MYPEQLPWPQEWCLVDDEVEESVPEKLSEQYSKRQKIIDRLKSEAKTAVPKETKKENF